MELLDGESARPAIVDSRNGAVVTYVELAARVSAAARQLSAIGGRPLVLHACTNSIDSIVLYLACLQARFPVCLLGPYGANPPDRIISCYRPEVMLWPEAAVPPRGAASQPFAATRYRIGRFAWDVPAPPAHPDLAVLLTTSGSTGTPKLVRLNHGNIVTNARSIASYLNLNSDERSIQGLPMHYSYGLSLINSHLLAGGTIVLTPHSFLTAEFWRDFDDRGCTSFAGVPYMYEALIRLGFSSGSHASLRTMTQAGGGLRPALIRAVHQQALHSGIRFFVMYGQTEATARISYVPPDRLGGKIGSIGIAIPGGHMEMEWIEDLDSSELIYRGPNVMMGYAESSSSLACGDELNGVLRTGDLVRRDSDGYFYVVGRLKRFAKLFGRRISLADVESDIEAAFPVRAAVIERSERLMVFLESGNAATSALVCGHVARRLSLPSKFITIAAVDALPITGSGKKDYSALSS